MCSSGVVNIGKNSFTSWIVDAEINLAIIFTNNSIDISKKMLGKIMIDKVR